MIAGSERNHAPIQIKLGGPCKQQHPFIPRLVVPEAFWAGLPKGDNPFDSAMRVIKQRCKVLCVCVRRQVCEKVGRASHVILWCRQLTHSWMVMWMAQAWMRLS